MWLEIFFYSVLIETKSKWKSSISNNVLEIDSEWYLYIAGYDKFKPMRLKSPKVERLTLNYSYVYDYVNEIRNNVSNHPKDNLIENMYVGIDVLNTQFYDTKFNLDLRKIRIFFLTL